MKSYTQNDLRKMYETPPRELTDRVQASIASLPCRGQEEKNVKNRISFGLIGVIALLIILMATALAATSDAVNHWLSQWWPEAAEAFRPVNLSCEDQGIRMEVISAVTDGSVLYVNCSLEDLEGDRLGNNADACIRTELDNFPGSTGSIPPSYYDAETGKTICSMEEAYDSRISPEAKHLTVYADTIIPGNTSVVDLKPLLREYGGQAKAMAVPGSAAVVEGYLLDGRFGLSSPDYEMGTVPDSMHVLDSSCGPEIPLAENLFLSGIGMIDGLLHVQMHYVDRKTADYGDVWCDPVWEDVYLYDSDEEIPVGEAPDPERRYRRKDRLPNGIHVLSWCSQQDEWEEYIFTVDTEPTEKQSFIVEVTTTEAPIRGSWEVKIPLQMIRQEDRIPEHEPESDY